MLKIAFPPDWSGFLNVVQNMNSNCRIIMWADTYIFYALGSMLWLKLYPWWCTRCKITVVTGSPEINPITVNGKWKYTISMNDKRDPNGKFSFPLGNVISIVTDNTVLRDEPQIHKGAGEARCNRPWAAIYPPSPPPGGFCKGIFFWKPIQNATKWAMLALWRLGRLGFLG